MLLGEPLDGAGKHLFGMRGCDPARSVTWLAVPLRSVFPSVACDAPLARFAAAAWVPLPDKSKDQT